MSFEAAPAIALNASNDPLAARTRVLDAGRIMLAADTLGAAQSMLDKAVAFAKERVQFGRVIGSFQGVKHTLADLATMKGRVRLVEREVHPGEIGRSLKDIAEGLGLRIIRDGTPYGFWRPQAQKLEQGDIVMEIVPTVS